MCSASASSTEFHGDRGHVRVLEDVSFDVGRGKIVGLVGIGSGKTVTALSLMGLVPVPPGRSRPSASTSTAPTSRNSTPTAAPHPGRDIAMVFRSR
jgi:peptide/nickel transport system ATP-binding protein/oligopeptide transport system ATP-binding protein